MKKPAMTLWYSEDSATGVWSLKLLKSHASCSPATEGGSTRKPVHGVAGTAKTQSEYAHITDPRWGSRALLVCRKRLLRHLLILPRAVPARSAPRAGINRTPSGRKPASASEPFPADSPCGVLFDQESSSASLSGAPRLRHNLNG